MKPIANFPTRRAILAGPLGTAAAARARGASRSKPNIVLIVADDLGYSDLGCYGNRVIHTPNLDRLASRGTRFTQFYVTSPACTPSRSAILTGRYPQRYGVFHSDLPEALPRCGLPADALTIGKAMQKAGYYTAHIGKWHVGEPPHAPEPRKQGFDYFFGGFGGRPSSPWFQYSRSMDPEMIENENRPAVYKGHVTEVETTAALNVIARMSRDRPFCLNVWYNAPHEPLAPLPNQKELYASWDSAEQTYYQTVTDLDRGIGRILAALEASGLAENTLIFFTSDNGFERHTLPYSRGSAWPLRGLKAQVWEGGVRVPGILYWPGKVPAGRVSTAIVSTLDLFPTFCAAAGASVPSHLDGSADLVAVANGGRQGLDRDLFFEYLLPQNLTPPSPPLAMRCGQWKLFSNLEFDTIALYDLEHDPGEQNDLAGERPDIVRGMKPRLERWWKQFQDKMDPNTFRTRVPVPTPEELEKRYYKN